MRHRDTALDRVGGFSDGVIAVIITIMVLELKPPEIPTFTALGSLWPTMLSYAVSYLFIAIVWVNHHHLLKFAEKATPRLLWFNFAHLFVVSLVPFATAWVALTRLASVPVFFYALIFVLVNVGYHAFQREVLRQAYLSGSCPPLRRMAHLRSLIALGIFLSAMLVALKWPSWGFVLVFCGVLMYLRPDVDLRESTTAEHGAGKSGNGLEPTHSDNHSNSEAQP
jgi:uncharacterized membrane protein